MNKLLKDAIADAKAVRETALANAKYALEEAFAPKLQSMLSHKIKEEMSDEDEMVEMEDEEEMTMEMSDDDEMTMEGEGGEPEMEDDTDFEEEDEVEVSDEDEVEVSDEEEGEMSDDELEEILRELEGEDEMEDMEEMDHNDDMDEMEMEDEEVDLDEIIRALREEDEDMEEMEDDKEAELEEAYKVIKFLRSKLNEINLLNAKLLFVNKLFKKGDLSESKKMKIVETFDRVKTVREAKLVYTTLSESIATSPVTKKKTNAKRRGLSEGFASTPTRATKKPIIENTAYNRFTELINYNK